jgi:MscS family membrane protein
MGGSASPNGSSEGDFVKLEDVVGTVEAIGLRSTRVRTRVRTLDRTLVSIPDGTLAALRVETLAACDRIRLFCTLGLVYETTSQQMRDVLAVQERVLREHPRFGQIPSSCRSKSSATRRSTSTRWRGFRRRTGNEFQLIRQEVLLGFMGAVEAAGSSFAFPTRTLHVVGNASQSASVS